MPQRLCVLGKMVEIRQPPYHEYDGRSTTCMAAVKRAYYGRRTRQYRHEEKRKSTKTRSASIKKCVAKFKI